MWYSLTMSRMRGYCKEGITTDTTSNYKFSLPDYSDIMDVKVLDENFTAIDEQLNTLETVSAAINAALANTVNVTYFELYNNLDAYSAIGHDVDKITFAEYTNSGGTTTTVEPIVRKDIKYFTKLVTPMSSNLPVFFRTEARLESDGGRLIKNYQYLLYSNGTMYVAERIIWDATAGLSYDDDFGAWGEVKSPDYTIFTS